MALSKKPNTLAERYIATRSRTEDICQPLQIEDYVVQPVVDVSPPKWHLGHTTWFFETFVLKPNLIPYQEFDANYSYVFNSYYETVGARVIRTDRGNLSRPTVDEVYRYRGYVDDAMSQLLQKDISGELAAIIELGLNHEEQHQELLLTDIKYILGHNPLWPAYNDKVSKRREKKNDLLNEFVWLTEGLSEVGHNGEGFCFDNELGRHNVHLDKYRIATQMVSNEEYLEFMNDNGYGDHRHWHSEGYEWVKNEQVRAPMYWHEVDGKWQHYTLNGLKPVDMSDLVCHVSFYEASAFAAWKGMRLPTEFEWEAAAPQLDWGRRWEWTNSAYLPYPGYKKTDGAIGEYNGKFMVNQMVLRGASDATPQGHSRASYRNFFHPHLRWQYTGIRLAK